jgi:serine/threonine protein kinase
VRAQIDSYEYLHSVGYIHKDLKGSNMLFSLHGPADGKIFLVDFGLVSKLTR